VKAFDLRLIKTQAESIKGETFDLTSESSPGFAVKFKAEVIDDVDKLAVGDVFKAKLSFTAFPADGGESFFSISLTGDLEVMEEAALVSLKSETGAYQAANYIFPYVRTLAKIMLEALGASAVEFPYHLPPPPKASKRKARASAKSATKNPA